MKRLSLAFVALTLLPGMVSAAPDLHDAAKDACKCLKEPYDQVKRAIESTNKAKTSGDMMKAINASNRCLEALVERYPEIDRSDELKDKVMDLMEELCPNPESVTEINP